jgi:hypothetical protein
MATAVKRKLSGSTDGRGIKIAATSSPGTTIHTAVSGTTNGTYDEIWLFAQNNYTTDILLTLEFGGTTNPDDNINVTISSKSGLMLIVPGLILQNSTVIKAYADTADYINITGFVNSITD